MASTSTKGEINAESVSCHQEFIRTSLESKRQLYTRTHVTARASGRNLKPLFHFLLPPQAALARARCRLQAFQVSLDSLTSPSHGLSLQPDAAYLPPSHFLVLFLVTCCSFPCPVQESESLSQRPGSPVKIY